MVFFASTGIVNVTDANAASKTRFKDLIGDWTLQSVDGKAPDIQLGLTFRKSQPMIIFTDGCRRQTASRASLNNGELLISVVLTKKVMGPCSDTYPTVTSTISSGPTVSIMKRKLLITQGSELVYVRA